MEKNEKCYWLHEGKETNLKTLSVTMLQTKELNKNNLIKFF